MPMHDMPCRIALISDNEIVIHGLQSMLSSTDASVSVTGLRELAVLLPVDVTLIDVSLKDEDEVAVVREVIASGCFGSVVLFGWDISSARAKRALLMGCRGCFDKSLSGVELGTALERVQRGEIVLSPSLKASAPEVSAGLSQRESQVIRMITWGCTNIEIAETLYLSVNTVKYYVRSAYRKIGVERRSQAVKWGIEHGMSLNRARADEFMLPAS